VNWYYVENGAQAGPISDSELEALRRSGRIQPETLVWHDGLSDWQPYSQAGPPDDFSSATAPPGASPGNAPTTAPVGLSPMSGIAPTDAARLDLQPMGIGDILDRTFRLYRANFMSFFLIMLIVQAIIYLVNLAWQVSYLPELQARAASGQHGGFFLGPTYFIGLVLTLIIGLILRQIAIGTLTVAVSAAFLGQPTSMTRAYKAVRSKLGTLFAATFLNSLGVGLGFMLCIIPGVMLALSWLLVSEVVVLEGLQPSAALKRSRELMRVKTDKGFVRNNVTKASVILLITFILASVAGGIVTIPFAIVALMQHAAHQAPQFFGPMQIAQGLLVSVVQAAVAPIGTVAMILFYYDIRIRKEGFDLEVLAAAMGGSQPPA
jgi:hypothetical protein